MAPSFLVKVFVLCLTTPFSSSPWQIDAVAAQANANRRLASAAEVNNAVGVAQTGDLNRAEQEFSRLARLYPRDPSVRTALGQLQVQLGDTKAGLSSFESVLRLDPSSAEAHVNLGIALASTGDLPGALRQSSAAIALAPSLLDAHLLRGRILADEGKDRKAKAELSEVLAAQPDSILALRTMVQVEQKLGDTPHLIDSLRHYLVLAPDDGQACVQLGEAYLSTDDNARAVPPLRRALQLQPSSSAAMFALSRALRMIDPTESKQLAAQVAAARSSEHASDEVRLLGAEGNEALEQGRYGVAISLFKRALAACGECGDAASLHNNLGLAFSRSEENAEAAREFRTAAASLKDADRISTQPEHTKR